MNIPNALTVLRILLVPVFGWLWVAGRHREALIVYGVASISDVLDGLLARVLHQPTRLGALLDPAADKLMLFVSYLVAAATGCVPVWLAAVVIGRDLVLAAGTGVVAIAFRNRGFSLRIHPTRVGKYSTFFQIVTIFAALAARALAHDGDGLRLWVASLAYLAGLFTLAAGAQYLGGAVLALVGAPAGVHVARARSTP